MTVAFWCVLVAGFLPYFGTLTAKIGGERFDNSNPRDWLNAQSGFRKRANAAQHNSFEAFPFFACGALLCLVSGVDRATLDGLCILFVGARIAYIACYLADKATLRSLVWAIGWFATIALYVQAIRGT